MKIILISSSPRRNKSVTFALAKHVLAGCAGSGARTETVFLSDLRIGFCRHCESCHKKILRCPIKDRAMALAASILDCDGIIYASPNYINQIPGSLKTLFDRHSHFIHCKRLTGKYAAAVVTSGSGYDLPVLRYLKYYTLICGGQFSGGISSRQDRIDLESNKAVALGKRLVDNIRSKREFPAQLRRVEKSRRYFSEVIKARRNDWKEEYLYWKSKGWL